MNQKGKEDMSLSTYSPIFISCIGGVLKIAKIANNKKSYKNKTNKTERSKWDT